MRPPPQRVRPLRQRSIRTRALDPSAAHPASTSSATRGHRPAGAHEAFRAPSRGRPPCRGRRSVYVSVLGERDGARRVLDVPNKQSNLHDV